jgi:co-chaperonin GroES (HSP10)
MDYISITDGTLLPIKDRIIVKELEQGNMKTAGGIILLDDNGKTHGIHPRWGCIASVGDDEKDFKPGMWVLVSHGRWTNGVKVGNEVLRMIEKKSILLTCETDPRHEQI